MKRTIRNLLSAVALALGVVLSTGFAWAGNQLAVAAAGYDVVSYFDDTPTRGEAAKNVFHNGAIWYFSSDANRDKFRADPAAYAPQYDGYCSWAASQGYKAAGDPLFYTVNDGKLYLQVHSRAHELWKGDIPGNIVKADENWPRIHPF
jgi:YHS domain-containing protein